MKRGGGGEVSGAGRREALRTGVSRGGGPAGGGHETSGGEGPAGGRHEANRVWLFVVVVVVVVDD